MTVAALPTVDRVVELLGLDVPAHRRLAIASEAWAVAWEVIYAHLRGELAAEIGTADPDALARAILARVSPTRAVAA